MSKITWWHFSDLHFRATDDFDRARVLTALWADVRRQLEEGLIPDFIVLTGDIAFSGKSAEYLRAEEEFINPLLELTSIEPHSLYMVPGNHDFDRDDLASLNTTTISSLESREKINEFLDNERHRRRYLEPFEAYSTFASRVTGSKCFTSGPAYAYCDSFEVAGTPVSIVGLNSAWTCHYHGPSSEKGRLLLGETQLISAYRSIPSDTIRITLLHHPLDWLAERELIQLKHELLHKTHFLLHGHVHQANEVAERFATDHQCLIYGAAACYDRRIGNDHYANGYSIVTLRPGAQMVTYKLRRYSDSPSPHWTSNEQVLGERSGGEHTSPIPGEWFGRGALPSSNRQPSTLNEIYRGSVPLARVHWEIGRALDAFDSSPEALVQFHRYEELACSSLVSADNASGTRPDLESDPFCLLFGEFVVRSCLLSAANRDGNPFEQAISEAERRLASLSIALDADLLRAVADCWRALCSWESPSYALFRQLQPNMAVSAAKAAFLALSAILFANHEVARSVLPLSRAVFEPSDPILEFAPPSRARVHAHSILELSISVRSPSHFMAVTLIRFHLERRMEQVVEAFAAINREFPFHAMRLQLLNRPDQWSEQHFTVDAPRVISLLMGKELYGEHNADVWFREVLQNGIDACLTRRRIDKTAPPCEIVVEAHPAARRVLIRDNGIGMSRWHIDHFFCRVGRSIWRSEELAQYSEDKKVVLFSIGKFGIGFLSIFDVAAQVAVTTRFCLDPNGYVLSISSIREPFFVKDTASLPAGTEIDIRFKRDTPIDLAALTRKFLVYQPPGIVFKGLGPIPATPAEALDQSDSASPPDPDVGWYKANSRLTPLQATLHLTIPLTRTKPDKTETTPDTRSVRVTNGGILVYAASSDWIGDPAKSHVIYPGSGVRGVRAIMDFDAGQAPVTASRNRIQIADSEAREVQAAIARLSCDIWKQFARDLFSEPGKAIQNTKILISALNHSAYEGSSSSTGRPRKRSWAQNGFLLEGAVSLLREYGSVEVPCEVDNYRPEEIRLADLLQQTDWNVILTSRERFKSQLVRLYCSQVPQCRVVPVQDDRAVVLLHACSPRWTRISSDEDLWEVIRLDESRDWRLCTVMPAESALVSETYFREPHTLALILPRRRASAAEVVGLHRHEVDLAPRVLFNRDHIVWKSLETRLTGEDVEKTTVADTLKLFFAAVVEEKSKTRRDREFQHLLTRLTRLASVPPGTQARISA